MFCGYCGAMLEEDSIFCGQCGTKVINNPEEPKRTEMDAKTFDKKTEVIIHQEKEPEDFYNYFYKPEDL
ncbi:zinc-ribbon domain-containing protein [Blautia sp. XA-2221]|uniref:zinc-ribbon domain-containing protein n=1 Tax=Blautia sp. XA-2221 TaxID=2903961 RepID=UPI00237A0793|nr:zinc-ribbon domain-containing protein [Blautia sp. XA-2221]